MVELAVSNKLADDPSDSAGELVIGETWHFLTADNGPEK
jgi:hypothetical protein